MSGEDRSVVWGRIGAYESWARTEDRTARTANGRAAFMARFNDAEDPEAARKAHFRRLAQKSAEARRSKARQKRLDAAAEAHRLRTQFLPPIHWRSEGQGSCLGS